MAKIRYSEFWDRIDVDAFEAAIEFEPQSQRGEEDLGFCPDFWGLHKNGDTTGKFAINREKRLYNCFVCGGGDFLSLVVEAFEMDTETATEWLYQFTHGDHRTDDEFLDYFNELIADVEKRTETMPYFNERALDRFDGDTSWFHTRGISDAIIERYNLRMGHNIMKSAPYKNGEKMDDDYYGDCAVFPHYWNGRLVGWQHRWLAPEDERPKWVPKYTNTTDFPKNETIFNFDNALRADMPVIVVESVPTVLFLESLGFASVGTFGSDIKETQLRLLRRFHHGVMFAPDNDPAPKTAKGAEKMPPGLKWANQGVRYLERFIPVSTLPIIDRGEGADLGDLAKDPDPYQSVIEVLAQAHEPEDTYFT